MGKVTSTVVRFVVAFLAFSGVLALVAGFGTLDPAYVFGGLIYLTPYLWLRHKDSDKTTLPFRGYFDSLPTR